MIKIIATTIFLCFFLAKIPITTNNLHQIEALLEEQSSAINQHIAAFKSTPSTENIQLIKSNIRQLSWAFPLLELEETVSPFYSDQQNQVHSLQALEREISKKENYIQLLQEVEKIGAQIEEKLNTGYTKYRTGR